MVFCYVILTIACIIILSYLILELNYFLRMTFCVLIARLLKKKIHILQETAVYGMLFN